MQRDPSWRGYLRALDARFSSLSQATERPRAVRTLAALLAHSGDSWFWLSGLALVGWLGSPYWKYRAAVLAASLVLTAVIVMAIKFSVRRSRPEGEWGQIYRRTDPHSFPSGHAARAALLATLALGLGPSWFGIALLVWTPLVALARVSMGVHFLTDVIAGLLLGAALGLLILLGLR